MRLLLTALLTAITILFTTTPSATEAQAMQPTDSHTAIQTARQVITLLSQGQFDQAYAMFNDTLQKALSEAALKSAWQSLSSLVGTYQGMDTPTVSTVQGYTVVTVTVHFSKGDLSAIVSIDPEGKIGGLNLRPIASVATTPAVLAPDEQEISFTSNGDTFYGTLLIPAGATGKIPAVLLISGSGPTDRDGNSTLLPGKVDSMVHFARTLANAGVASLRYDKYGTGKTGLGSFAGHPADLTFESFVDPAEAAYQYLAGRPEINSSHLAILGHSEGGLIALTVADRLKATPLEPAALILAAPLSKLYLVTIRDQIAAQYAAALNAGLMTQAQVESGLASLDQIIAQVTAPGTLPASIDPALATLFNAGNTRFLHTAEQYDPQAIAHGLPTTLSVLILCGQKDQQVLCADVQQLVDAFEAGGNPNVQFSQLPNVDHVFKEIAGPPNPATDYTDPTKPFSAEASQLIGAFVKAALG